MPLAALRDDVLPKDHPDAFKVLSSNEYAASSALLDLAKAIGLDSALYSKPSLPWVRDTLAMIVGRIVYQGSKLFLSHQWENTALWELCGTEGPVDVDEHCYAPLDRLLERQDAIQQTLAKTHLSNGGSVLYDITSSYFEGQYEESEIAQFGYNLNGKRGREQTSSACLLPPVASRAATRPAFRTTSSCPRQQNDPAQRSFSNIS